MSGYDSSKGWLCRQSIAGIVQGLSLFHNTEFGEKLTDLVSVISQGSGDVGDAVRSQVGEDAVP